MRDHGSVNQTVLREVKLDPEQHQSTGKDAALRWWRPLGRARVFSASSAIATSRAITSSISTRTALRRPTRCNDSLDDALRQAEFEFAVKPAEWSVVAENASP